MQNLMRRPSGIYVVRLVVPMRLRARVGRREMIASTKSRHLSMAKLIATSMLAQWRRRFFDLERPGAAGEHMTHDSIVNIVDGHPALNVAGHITLTDAAALSGVGVPTLLREAAGGRLAMFTRFVGTAGYLIAWEPDELTDKAAFLAMQPDHDGVRTIPLPSQMPDSARSYVASGALRMPEDTAVAVASDLLLGAAQLTVVAYEAGPVGIAFIPNGAVTVQLASIELHTSDVELLRRSMAVLILPDRLEAVRTLQLASVQGRQVSAGKHAQRRFSEALAAYVPAFLPKKIGKTKEVERVRTGISLFIELVGDLKLAQIDADVLRTFRDKTLATVVARENHVRSKFKTSSMTESIAAVAGTAWPVMSAAERDLRMQWIGRMFQWLTDQKWITDNPATSLIGESVLSKVEQEAVTRRKKPRVPFDDADLQRIFAAPWFASGRGELTLDGKAARGFQPFQYWMPLLALLCSARIGEVSQLWLSDVRQTAAGVWFIDINQVTADKHLKNNWSTRKVPIHPVLIEAGFVLWCDRLRSAGFKRVFPELSWNETNQYAKEPIRAHSAMFKGMGMPRNNTKVFHSFRRTLNTALERLPGVSDIARKRILGHQPGEGVNERHYLDDRQPGESIVFMRTLDFKLPVIAPFDVEAGFRAVVGAHLRKVGRRRGVEDMGPA